MITISSSEAEDESEGDADDADEENGADALQVLNYINSPGYENDLQNELLQNEEISSSANISSADEDM